MIQINLVRSRRNLQITDSILRTYSHSRPYNSSRNFFQKSKVFRPCNSRQASSFGSSSSITTSKVGILSWYLGMVKAHPIVTKSITSSLVYTAADLSSQMIARSSSEPFDVLRTLRMAGYGMLILGPSLHYWFNFLSKVFPKRDMTTTLKKIIMGQISYGPAMTTIFFSLNAGLQGENVSEIIARLKRDLIPAMINGVIYWPFCDFVTFKFIPVHLQPLVSNSFSFLWTIYMTYMAGLDKPDSK